MDWISTQLDEVGGMQAPAMGVNKGTEGRKLYVMCWEEPTIPLDELLVLKKL